MKIIKEFIPYLIIIIVAVTIRTFIATPVRVDGDSMNPTLKDGNILILKKYDDKYERFDIIVLKSNGEKLIKRVIGLPGEKVLYKDNKLYINNQEIEDVKLDAKTNDYALSSVIPENYYFVLGDNRTNSVDSRIIGLVSKKDILGTTSFRLFPFNKMGTIK